MSIEKKREREKSNEDATDGGAEKVFPVERRREGEEKKRRKKRKKTADITEWLRVFIPMHAG